MTIGDSDWQKSVRKVLIYRLGSLGDTVIALPAFHLIARAFPQAERRLLTSFPPNAKAPASSAILENTGLVHSYFRYTLRTRSAFELIKLWWQLLRWRPEVLVYVNPGSGVADAKRNAIFFRLCGISKLIGIPVTEDMQRSRKNREIYDQGGSLKDLIFEYESSRLTRNISGLGAARLDDPASWDLKLTPEEKARGEEAIAPLGDRPFLAVSLGTKNQANEWGTDNWCALLECLGEYLPAYSLVLCGAQVEFQESEQVLAAWKRRTPTPGVNLCGKLTPRQSAGVFARAAAFIGHDSGPMHLAACVQTTCIAVFSARNLPGIWYPYGEGHHVLYHHVDCEGCHLQTCIEQKKKCILSITVDEVLTRVMSALSEEVPGSGHSRLTVIRTH